MNSREGHGTADELEEHIDGGALAAMMAHLAEAPDDAALLDVQVARRDTLDVVPKV